MPLYSFEGRTPAVHPEAWVAPNATVLGEVILEAGASVWYGAVLRADFGPIVIRAGANIQDGSVLHSGPDPLVIGPGTTIGHLCVVHNCVIGTEALIGNGAVVQDGARIGDRALVAAGSLVPPGMVVPDERMAMGAPATVKGPLSPGARWWVETNPGTYQELAKRHAAGAVPVEEQR
jgi:carbonic anhydrase/acetyltransferase-like protein (isoleucine patch superfamily)